MPEMIRVLIAEDEASLGMIVRESLETRGFEVFLCADGVEAMQSYRENAPHVVVLDVMMPRKDGFTVAQEIRKSDPFVPIIFVTSKSRTEDVVEGFGYGANDYIKKPFSMEEMIVRIRALAGRNHPPGKRDEWIDIGNYSFHADRQILRMNENEELLTHREAQLLLKLYQHRNDLTDRSSILRELWGDDDFFNARSMDVFISKLRKKLAGDPSVQILNVRGYGYKLVF